MKIAAAGLTEKGASRLLDEDALLVDPETRLFVVSDGSGGPGRGDVASRLTCQSIAEHLYALRAELGGMAPSARRDRLIAGVRQAMDHASRVVFGEAFARAERTGLGATAVVCQLAGDSAIVGHVGDSRVYLFRDQQTYQLTSDHTVHAELLDRGLLTPEEASAFAHKHVLSRWIGAKPAVDVDLTLFDLLEGDRLLLCSDGLGRALPFETITAVMRELPPEDSAPRLLTLAKEAGGDDDVTVIVVAVEELARGAEVVSLEKKVAHLQQVFLFSSLTFQEMLRVLEVVRESWVEEGEAIVTEGEVGDTFYVIALGEVVVSHRGKELTRLGEGAHFGELALLGSGRRSATVTAATDVVLLSIGEENLRELLGHDLRLANKLMWRFLQNLATRVTRLSDDLAG